MKSVSGKLVVIMALVLMVLISIFPGCRGPVVALDPIEVHLSFSEPPILNKPVQITVTFNLALSYPKKVHDVQANITLSEGIQLVDGNLNWKGDLSLGQTQTIQAIVKTVKLGTYLVGASAWSEPDAANGSAGLYVTVTENDATISKTLPHVAPTPVQTDPPPGYPVPTDTPVKPLN